MFLGTEKTKVVQANKDNIVYYNKIYEDQKSKKAKAAAIARKEYIRTHQPSIIKKIFCCAKPYTGDKQDDDREIEDVVYSAGESGDEENKLGRLYLKMKEKDK
jgi:hypothetical protein